MVIRKKIILGIISILSIVLVSTMIGSTYACFTGTGRARCTPSHNCNELQIRDQDEGWGDGVSATWMVDNMVPGTAYNLEGSFVGLKSRKVNSIGISCDYKVLEGALIESDTDPLTWMYPDRMAKALILTEVVYRTGLWEIDLLTGQISGISSGYRCNIWCPSLSWWRIRDVDGDTIITFYDFKNSPLYCLPISDHQGNWEDARFTMSVRFAESAGNEFQGDTFVLAMSYSSMP